MRYIFLVLSIVLVSACTKYQPQFEGATPLSEEIVSIDYKAPIVYAEQYLIGLTNTRLNSFDVVLRTAAPITGMAVNDKMNTIAYQTQNDNIHLVDFDGKLIKELSGTKNVISFEFHSSGTLYMCTEVGQVNFEGPAIPIRSTNLKSYISDAGKFYGMIILGDNRVFTLYQSSATQNVRENLSSPTQTIDDGYVESDLIEVMFMRAYDYNQNETDYNFYVRANQSFGGQTTWQYKTNNTTQSYLQHYRQSDNDIDLSKKLNGNSSLSYIENSGFYYFAGQDIYEWPNFTSRPNKIIFIDF